jgi:hypothetical protein
VFEQVLEGIVNYQTSLTPGERNIENCFKFVSRNFDTAHMMIEFVLCVCVCVDCLLILSITEHNIRLYGGCSITFSPITVTSPIGSTGRSDFHYFGPLKKHLSGKPFATDADVKQVITSWLQPLDTNFLYVVIQALAPQWDMHK